MSTAGGGGNPPEGCHRDVARTLTHLNPRPKFVRSSAPPVRCHHPRFGCVVSVVENRKPGRPRFSRATRRRSSCASLSCIGPGSRALGRGQVTTGHREDLRSTAASQLAKSSRIGRMRARRWASKSSPVRPRARVSSSATYIAAMNAPPSTDAKSVFDVLYRAPKDRNRCVDPTWRGQDRAPRLPPCTVQTSAAS